MSGNKRAHQHIIEAGGLRVTFDEKRLSWSVRKGRTIWETAAAEQCTLRGRDGKEREAKLQTARSVKTYRISNTAQEGIVCELADFAGLGRGMSLRLTLALAVETATGDLVATIDGSEEGVDFVGVCWPGAVKFEDAAVQETVMPFMQGALIPGNWPTRVTKMTHFPTHSRWLYMPWWGQRKGGAGYTAILETDADAGCRFMHPTGGPTQVGPWWMGSLGKVGYPRTVRYSFFDKCDYVSMCKHYRRHVMRAGRFVSLREKIAAAPKAGRLIGAAVVHTGVARTIHPDIRWYDKEHPEKNFVRRPFREVAKGLKALKALGVRDAYIHLDGWGVRGYDNRHPDYLPPCPECGGWAGMRRLTETCANLGYLIALHDQYRDYYHDAATFDPEQAIRESSGEIPYECSWDGGPQSILCQRFAPAYIFHNHKALRDRGIKVDGSYLDVFAIVPLEECYHPGHRMSRRESGELRARCFAIIRDLEGIVSSEEPVDYAVPHLHLVHHGPMISPSLDEFETGKPLPTVPLWTLVYHDALLLPWGTHTEAGLFGGMPYLALKPSRAQIAGARRVGRLHSRVALEEMVGHEFLNEDHTRQRTVFADGTVVTADLKGQKWEAKSGPRG